MCVVIYRLRVQTATADFLITVDTGFMDRVTGISLLHSDTFDNITQLNIYKMFYFIFNPRRKKGC